MYCYIQVSPFGVLKPTGAPPATVVSAINKLVAWARRLGRHQQPHPGHVALFEKLQQVDEQPLVVLCSGSTYWQGTEF